MVQEVEGAMVMWNPCFLRHFQDWEMDNVKEVLRRLYMLGTSSGREKMVWKARKRWEILDEIFLLHLGIGG